MQRKLRVVFFGTEGWGIPSLKALIEQHSVVGIVTKADARAGRGNKLTSSPVKELALSSNIPVFEPAKLGEYTSKINELSADIGVVIAYGKFIPDEIIEVFEYGIINCHPSALPRYRGPSPIESAILAGEPVKVSIIQLSAEMDAGDILAQAEIGEEQSRQSSPELYETAGLIGSELLIEVMNGLAAGTLRPRPQDNAQATISTKISKADGSIDWSKPAIQIEREIRAYAGWPGSKALLDDVEITITSAYVSTTSLGTSILPGTPLLAPEGSLAFQTGQGILVINRLKPAGKKEMSGRSYLAGNPLKN
jgi:methionyl-tRNA formyltransferase